MDRYLAMLAGACTKTGEALSANATDDGTLMVTIEGREELPVVVSADATQVLCVTYLCEEREVRAEKRTEMLERMLAMNVPMPLSACGVVNGRYVLFGALPTHCTREDLITEIDCLSDNTLEAIESLADCLG